jgi:hypothetical protein
MAIYKLTNEKLTRLPPTSFEREGIGEVQGLQKSIINSIDAIEESLFVLCNEFGDWEDSKRRIDILCLDKNANLVVVELKRTDDGGHMELQAIRYAAMVASMTFEKAVNAYEHYIQNNNIKIDETPEEAILNFLGWSDVEEEHFANDVRIILISADFSKEITTAVLWLLDRDIDIKCVRIKPSKDTDALYLEVQQIIPLPETTDYQVKLREKAVEQRQARREGSRDYTKYDVSINGEHRANLNKRETMFFVISQSVKGGITPEELMRYAGGEGRWLHVDKHCSSRIEFEAEYCNASKRKYDSSRWFNNDDELIHANGKTYVYSNQHGGKIEEFAQIIFEKHPELQGTISKAKNS